MHMILFLACSTSPPPVDYWGAYNQCTMYDHMPSCYLLKDAPDQNSVEVGLETACRQGYRDACRILYDRHTSTSTIPSQSTAYAAAVDGCLKSQDRFLCERALEFPQRNERFGPMLERFRAEIDAVLATTPANGQSGQPQ